VPVGRVRLAGRAVSPEERDVLVWALGVAYREATRSEGLAEVYPRSVDGGATHAGMAAIYRGRAAVLRGMLA